MDYPKKVWLHIHHGDLEMFRRSKDMPVESLSFVSEKINDSDVKYIRADLVIAEIDRRIRENNVSASLMTSNRNSRLKELNSFLNWIQEGMK